MELNAKTKRSNPELQSDRYARSCAGDPWGQVSGFEDFQSDSPFNSGLHSALILSQGILDEDYKSLVKQVTINSTSIANMIQRYGIAARGRRWDAINMTPTQSRREDCYLSYASFAGMSRTVKMRNCL